MHSNQRKCSEAFTYEAKFSFRHPLNKSQMKFAQNLVTRINDKIRFFLKSRPLIEEQLTSKNLDIVKSN